MSHPRMTFQPKNRIARSVAACSLAAAVCVSAAHAQPTTVFSEDFNVDNNGVNYTLFGRYFNSINQMFDTAPGIASGRPMLAAIDSGGVLANDIDGVTTAPARRVGIFVDSRHGETAGDPILNDDGWGLLDNSVHWATETDGSTPLNITYLRDPRRPGDADFPFPTRFFDDEWMSRLTAAGHNVTEGDPRKDPPAGQDLIIMGTTNHGLNGVDYRHIPDGPVDPLDDDFNMIMSGDVNAGYRSLATPIISGLYHGTNELGFGNDRGDDTSRTDVEISTAGAAHPISGSLGAGLVEVVPAGVSPVRLAFIDRSGANSLAPGATIIAAEPGTAFDPGMDFTSFEGAGYLRMGEAANFFVPADGEPRRYDVIGGINLANVTGAELTLLAGASEGGTYEEDEDFIRIFGQDGPDGTPELIGEFIPDIFTFDLVIPDPVDPSNEPLVTLTTDLQEVTFTLPASIATSADMRLSIEMFNTDGDERIALDNIRIIGEVAAGLVGDFNQNGVVDAADYTVWRDNLGSNTPLANDGGLGTPVGEDHYTLWKTNFGLTAGGSGASSSAAGAVPEPTSAVMAMIALVAIGVVRRRSAQ